MKLVIDIAEHNKSVIDRFVDGEGFEILPVPIVDYVVRAIRNGKPAVHGKWLQEMLNGREVDVCSNCQHIMHKEPVWAFCPLCGADMREVGDKE